MTRLQYLSLQFNSLYSAAADTPALLPSAWTLPQKRGFSSLSMLTLFPGNDNICSIPSTDGGFLDVNKGARAGGRAAARGVLSGRLPRCAAPCAPAVPRSPPPRSPPRPTRCRRVLPGGGRQRRGVHL